MRKPEQVSNTSVCLSLDLEADQVKQMVSLLAEESVAYDIGAYRDARQVSNLVCAVEQSDIEALLPWLNGPIAK